MKQLLFVICLLHIVFYSFAQKKNAAFQVHIHKASSLINIDGSGDEPAWQEAETAGNFFMVLPMDTSYAQVKTEVKVTYDEHYFYLLATCYKAVKGVNMVESLHRDFTFGKE